MKSLLATGKTIHRRYLPIDRSFTYPVTFYLLDLDELSELSERVNWFSVDKFNLMHLNQSDYGDWKEGEIKAKIINRCKQTDQDFKPGRVRLLTMPRTLGYVFNPVSFYLVDSEDGCLEFLVMEINNTFYERCQYVLQVNQEMRASKRYHWKFNKDFHVSPFLDMDYLYEVTFTERDKKMSVTIVLSNNEERHFESSMAVDLRTISLTSHLLSVMSNALTISMTMPRILFQAALLSLIRRIPVLSKPNPNDRVVVRATPVSWVDQVCLRIGRRYLNKLQVGKLVLTLPDGRREFYGDQTADQVDLKIHNYDFYRRVLLSGSVGFGESFTAGDWTSSNPAAVVALFLNNYENLKTDKLAIIPIVERLNRLRHLLRRNSISGSRRNISEHYDLNNDFFNLFLDSSMLYSSGIYASSSASLEDAQQQKIDTIAKKARLKPNSKVLEIGSGWGAMAELCAEAYGCTVTSLTLSQEQLAFASRRAASKGLSSMIEYRLQDYRETEGRFDSIVSIEMLEAVGAENLDKFFSRCSDLLLEDGVLVVQVIGYPDTHYEDYCRGSDWIQKHIFPGSHLPSLSACIAAAKKASLVVDSVENYAADYAATLREWRKRFDAREQEVLNLGFDQEFIRKWRFYLASCEAEFHTRWLSLYQIVFTRPNNLSAFESVTAQSSARSVA